jgi:hypothetical protein
MSNSRMAERTNAPHRAISRAVPVPCVNGTRARTPQHAAWAPAGYDATDIGILEWIASHRRGMTERARLAN